ncbi:rab-GTPase-TBC domain-containing protein [Cantharellus anzutake]|uniref:rab-GTPase-TBC domain-containing protein n=1 Tax=Cantharellus anzutake TaxID=1750568 RepID=UPI001904E60B|nr:rab-GTPase-TBC domain-containing protein [Cantharellus anzutake]KAF8330808.1 rab-GTPase-TBC domain-containing protein [Cantharellus anzutake]
MSSSSLESTALDAGTNLEVPEENHAHGLEINDAFSTDEDLETDVIDLPKIVSAVRSSNELGRKDSEALPSTVRRDPSDLTTRVRRGSLPSLRVVTSDSPTAERDRFENVSLSPPPSPFSTAGLSPNQVPIPVSPTSPISSGSHGSPKSSHNQQGPILRSVSPKPTYLSPSSTIPTPPSVDPVSPASPSLNSNFSRPSSSIAGPSTLEKVVSKTRPSHLPPKQREEDLKHMRVWEEMMKRSREAEAQKEQIQQERRASKEVAMADAIGIWEREIIPDWRAAVRKTELRRLWWSGIPTKLRGKLWFQVVGNGLALSKDAFRTCRSRAQRAIASKVFPPDVMEQIEQDIVKTLPTLHIFHPDHGPMYQDLKELMCSWVVARSDEGLGYVKGASQIGAMLLLNLPLDQAFITMRNLIERHCLRSFFGGEGSDDDLEAYYRIFDTLLADGMPKVYFNFKQHHISPSLYLPEWIRPLFLNHLPFEACARIWDVIILEGDSFMFRMAIAVLGVLESRLFFPDRKELLDVLRGENKAALEIAKRTGVAIDHSARYEQYGMSEEVLWARVSEMDEWWRETTWLRLIQRELPDL